MSIRRIPYRAVPALVAALALAISAPAFASHGRGSSGSSGKPAVGVPAPPAPSGRVQGVVQSVLPSAVSVRLLDGTAASVPYDKKTQVLVNGRPGRLADVRPGFVLAASWKAGKPAGVLRFVRPS
ncbi:MAG TPA: hypothetical protein VH063_13270 [Gaiellaceae bacterium]|nr:hypothetical protein [Gaiellaceae bacterium]